MTTETAAKRDTQKLQRAIVDGLEDVKAQDIQVFDTEHLSSLFERVIIASGTSNRQTKALAASVRDAVREAGFPKPRIEGEANGEWIIVDCSQAVVHIMQPTFRSYYHLEELWGEKPVRLKFGATRPVAKSAPANKLPAAKKASAKSASAKTTSPGKPRARKAAAKKGRPGSAAAVAPPATGRVGARAPAKSAVRKPAPLRAAPARAAPARAAPAKAAPAKAARKTPARKA